MARLAASVLLALLLAPIGAAEAGAPAERFLVSFDGDAPRGGAVLGPARVIESFAFANIALVEAPAGARGAIARLPGVVGVYDEEPITLNMERERGIVGAEAPASADWPDGAGVGVALIDSGIDASHPAFTGRVAASVRISRAGVVSGDAGDADGHGTHVAGIVGGDGAGSADGRHRGIAPAATLVGVDISDSFTTTNAVRAFAWVHENAGRYNIRVVSNSWGREKEETHFDEDDPVIRASNALVESGLVVVFSAGNRGRDGGATLTPEAMNPNVITVGAASGTGRVEGYSSRGPAIDGDGNALAWTKPDLMAPGTAVVSTRAGALAASDARSDEERYYTVMNGTSMAAPQVAAAAALVLSEFPHLAPRDVQAILQRSAADLGASGVDSDTGFGMLDVAAALHEASRSAGGERRVIVETRVPVHDSGTAAAALGQIVLTGNTPHLPPATATTIPLAMPAGAAAVDLWFNWTGDSSFSVRLIGPEGAVAFEAVGGRVARLETSVAPGAYRVEATPTGVAGYATFTLAGSIVVREERVVEVAAEPHGRPIRASNAFSPPTASDIVNLDVIARAPFLVLALAGTVAVGFSMRRRAA